jgi:hypothetical protein
LEDLANHHCLLRQMLGLPQTPGGVNLPTANFKPLPVEEKIGITN